MHAILKKISKSDLAFSAQVYTGKVYINLMTTMFNLQVTTQIYIYYFSTVDTHQCVSAIAEQETPPQIPEVHLWK